MNIKQPTTYQEQAVLIENKGFHIEDMDSCISFLKQANYYRLSAYFLPFRYKNGSYFHGIMFHRIQHIYEFDSHIRSLLFQVVEQIEFYLRTQLSYHISHKYGALGYLDNSIFSEKHDSEKFSAKLQQIIEENIQTPVVKHHMEKYNGKFPLWVIIEFFSMGMLSYLYNDLHSEDQKAIAKDSFSTSVPCLKSWLRCITDLRNRCAHYSRLYYWIFPAIPKMPKNYTYKADRKLFSQILMLKHLYPDIKHWNNHIVTGIEALIQEYQSDISLKHIGFPNNWEEILTLRSIL